MADGPFPVSVSVQGLGFSYNGHPALQDVSLDVRQGEFVALMGRNGSGKTTLLKQLVGLLKPDQGQVEISGSRFAAGHGHAAGGRRGD